MVEGRGLFDVGRGSSSMRSGESVWDWVAVVAVRLSEEPRLVAVRRGLLSATCNKINGRDVMRIQNLVL
jgi:hypothetical protein